MKQAFTSSSVINMTNLRVVKLTCQFEIRNEAEHNDNKIFQMVFKGMTPCPVSVRLSGRKNSAKDAGTWKMIGQLGQPSTS